MSEEHNWKFAQCFGDKGDSDDITDGKKKKRKRKSSTKHLTSLLFLLLADIISTVEFDQTGDYLATGDKGGRVVLFERNESVKYLLLQQQKKKFCLPVLFIIEKEL